LKISEESSKTANSLYQLPQTCQLINRVFNLSPCLRSKLLHAIFQKSASSCLEPNDCTRCLRYKTYQVHYFSVFLRYAKLLLCVDILVKALHWLTFWLRRFIG